MKKYYVFVGKKRMSSVYVNEDSSVDLCSHSAYALHKAIESMSKSNRNPQNEEIAVNTIPEYPMYKAEWYTVDNYKDICSCNTEQELKDFISHWCGDVPYSIKDGIASAFDGMGIVTWVKC